MADDGRLGFGVDIDFLNYDIELEKAKAHIDEFTSEIIRRGKEIDAVLSELGKNGFDVSTTKNSLASINEVLEDSEIAAKNLSKEISELKEQIESLQGQPDNAAERNKLVDELGKKLKQLAEVDADIAQMQGVKSYLEGVAEETEEVIESTGNATSDITKLTRSVSQLSSIFRNSKNPLVTFRSLITGVNGGIKLSTISFKNLGKVVKSLWSVLKANPLGLVVTGLAALTKVVQPIVKQFKETHDEAQKLINTLNNQSSTYNNYENYSDLRNAQFDEQIKAKEQEVNLAKANNVALEKQRQLEEELIQLKQQKANWNVGYWGVDIKNIEANQEALYKYKEMLGEIEKAKEAGDKKITLDLELNGKVSEYDIEKAFKYVQGQIDLTNRKIELGVKIKDEERRTELENANKRNAASGSGASSAKERYRNELDAVRSLERLRISMITDSYLKEKEEIKNASKERIEDLNYRLKNEKNLTKKAKEAISEEIKLQQQKLNKDLEDLENKHQQKLLQLSRETRNIQNQTKDRTAEQRRKELEQQYRDQMQDLQNEINFGGLSEDEKEKKRQQINALAKLYRKELSDLNDELYQEQLEREKESIELRLESVRKGSQEELKLRLALLEKERQAELADNLRRPEEEQQDEKYIEAKYSKRATEIRNEYSDEYIRFLRSLDNLTVLEMEKLRGKLNEQLLSGKNGKGEPLSEADILRITAMISELDTTIEEAHLSPDKKSAEQWKKYAQQISDIGSSISDLSNEIGGVVGETLSQISELVSSSSAAIEKCAELAAGTLQGLDKTSAIITIIASAIKLVNTLNNIIPHEETKWVKEHEEAYRKQEKAVNDLKREYEKLSDAIAKAFGSEKSRLLTRQIEIAREQLEELVKEYDKLNKKQDEYNNKKWWQIGKKDLTDEEKDRLEELGYEIEDQMQKLADLRQAAVDAIFGNDIQSAIESFANAYTKAWEDGSDSAKNAADFVKDIMRQVVNESIKAAIMASGKIDEIRKFVALSVAKSIGGAEGLQILQSLMKGESISSMLSTLRLFASSSADALIDMANYSAEMLSYGLDSVYSQFSDLYADSTRSGANRGIAQASQDSVDELNGRMTAVQGHTFNLSENSNIIRDSIVAINGNVAMIRNYTEHLVRMDNDINNIRMTMSEIQSQGLIIR